MARQLGYRSGQVRPTAGLVIGAVYDGDLDKAVKDFSKAIELKAKDGVAWNNRSRVYAQLGRWEKVVEDCLEITTGAFQASLLLAAAEATFTILPFPCAFRCRSTRG